ncbi:MAG: YoaK family protein [Bacteriovoracaceae bacterium]
MLYGNTSISYYSRGNILIWLIMAFQAGLLNIGGFLAGQKIVSHVTGFATFSGYYISQGQKAYVIEMLILPIVFLLGAMVSGHFVDIRLKLNKQPKYYITFGFMFVLTLAVFINGIFGNWGAFGNVGHQSFGLLMLLCFICGIQNATVSIVSRSVIRTTHLTGLTTDLGLGIVRFFKRKELESEVSGEGRSNLMRVGIISSFVMGAIVGGFVFKRFEFYGFLLPVLISGGLFSLMVYFHTWGRKNSINGQT